MSKQFHVGDYVKRTSNFWNELDADTVYIVTEVIQPGNGFGSEIRVIGGESWPDFFYTADYFTRVTSGGEVLLDNVDISGQRIVFADDTSDDTKDPEDIITVQSVQAQWDIGETVKQPTPPPVDVVNHPSHYKFANGVEVIDLTEQLNFNCGNVVKYTARAGRKDATKQLEDLRKAEFYIKREIKRVESAGEDL